MTFRCFCFGEAGERIYGWNWWRVADEMTCACSRQRHKAEAAGRLDVTLHCLPSGNFEPLQCDMGICWCADESDGQIMEKTFAVPESLWTYLPCCKTWTMTQALAKRDTMALFLDNASFHGDQYLRRCESAAYAQKIMQKKLIKRGAINAVPNQIRCNYDGTYGDIVVENPLWALIFAIDPNTQIPLFRGFFSHRAFCQMPDGSKLNFATPTKMMTGMNCSESFFAWKLPYKSRWKLDFNLRLRSRRETFQKCRNQFQFTLQRQWKLRPNTRSEWEYVLCWWQRLRSYKLAWSQRGT